MDISAAYDEMALITSSASSVTQGMNALLDYIAQVQSSPVWSELRHLDYQGEVVVLQRWLEGMLTSEPPAPEVKVYWFGIFNPVVDDEASCAFYVSGPTQGYSSETLDWACWNETTYLPANRYAPSHVVSALYRASHGVEGAGLLGEYTLCLGYVCLVASELARVLDPSLLLGEAEKRTIAAGFDDGDDLLLGTVHKSGWQPNPALEVPG